MSLELFNALYLSVYKQCQDKGKSSPTPCVGQVQELPQMLAIVSWVQREQIFYPHLPFLPLTLKMDVGAAGTGSWGLKERRDGVVERSMGKHTAGRTRGLGAQVASPHTGSKTYHSPHGILTASSFFSYHLFYIQHSNSPCVTG